MAFLKKDFIWYLPLFPTQSADFEKYLLRSNLKFTKLDHEQQKQRMNAKYIPESRNSPLNYDHRGDCAIAFCDIYSLAERLRVDPQIVSFNADRLRQCCFNLRRTFNRSHPLLSIVFDEDADADDEFKLSKLTSKHMSYLLEFYLQMDVDVFYMKTCRFRGSDPYPATQGLFCSDDGPFSKHWMLPCDKQECHGCYPINIHRRIQKWPVIDCVSSSKHQFVNGYRTYLNCPATCKTSNIIYVMTCRCGKYDCIQTTSDTLIDELEYHRKYCNLMIHEYLTGSRISKRIDVDISENGYAQARKMRIYQHVARCSVALKIFIECNPQYRCFVPRRCRLETVERYNSTGEYYDQRTTLYQMVGAHPIANPRVAYYMDRIPIPPVAYTFTPNDRHEQINFFVKMLEAQVLEHVLSDIDLYQYKIIAVLPKEELSLFRCIAACLFLVRCGCKLNMYCPIGGDTNNIYGHPYSSLWCEDLWQP